MGKGKRNKLNNKKKGEPKPPIPYTESERNKKITNIILQLSSMDMTQVLTPEIRTGIQKYIKEGAEYEAELDLPEFARTLQIKLVNDKRRERDTYVKFLFKKIRIEGEGDDNPINKLNMLQEEMFQEELANKQG
jgi:hypothetical protein